MHQTFHSSCKAAGLREEEKIKKEKKTTKTNIIAEKRLSYSSPSFSTITGGSDADGGSGSEEGLGPEE
jgi:hypothetical protein